MTPVFITGIGTDVGKTLVSSIVVKALGAAYWKPIQAGGLDNTDGHIVRRLAGDAIRILPEHYLLRKPASPHISAAEEGIDINIAEIAAGLNNIKKSNPEYLVIEGAGGLLVPINKHQTVADLVKALQVPLILVSRNYLGSINHSLLTAEYCRHHQLPVAGWIFTDEFMGYEEEICARSGFPGIGLIPFMPLISPETVADQAALIRPSLINALNKIT